MTTGDGPYDGGASDAGGREKVSPVPEPGPRGASRGKGGGFGRWEIVYLVFVAGCLWLFATVLIQDFHNPILGAGDRNIAGYLGYYVAHNLHLWPIPHLGLTNDQMLYPYGNTQVFLSWAFEQDLLWTALDRLFGNGPWLQVYFLSSVAITVVGSYLLVRREWGPLRAAYLSFVVGFGSYAAIWRWPFHASLALIHWTVLNVVADAIIARRVWHRRQLSARLLLVRAALVVLCLGLDLGYVAGMALTSFLVTAVFVTAVVWRRSKARWPFTPSRIAGWRRALAASWTEHRVQNASIALITAVAAWLLIPLVLEVALTARRYDFSKIPDHVWWSNPIRLLIPIFPGFNPMMPFRLGDSPEGQFSGSPGIFFVLAAVLGLVTAKKGERGATLSLLALLGLFLAYHPRVVPLQHVLPWFQFDRVTGRFALIYPTILALVSLAVPTGFWRRTAGKVAIIALGGVLAVEGATAYSLVLIRPLGNFVPDRSFRNLMNAIATAPGEAVMEWPFCVAAGNGIGTGELCPFYNVQAGLFGLRQLHGKKIVSQYYGRSHPSQIEPLLRAGWPSMFLAGPPGAGGARRQERNFLPNEWRFLERFFRLGDFCGIVIYPDLLPRETVLTFHRALGEPVAAASFPAVGRMEFFPKPAAWRRDVDVARARRIRFEPTVLAVALDIDMTSRSSDRFLDEGWSGPDTRFRWTCAPQASLHFGMDPVGAAVVELTMSSFQPQRILVEINGTPVGSFNGDGTSLQHYQITVPASLMRSENRLTFRLPDAHSPRSVGMGGDARLLGASVARVRIVRAVEPESSTAGRSRDAKGPH